MISRSQLKSTLTARRLTEGLTVLPAGVFYIAGMRRLPPASMGDVQHAYTANGQFAARTKFSPERIGPVDVQDRMYDMPSFLLRKFNYGLAFRSSPNSISSLADQLSQDLDRESFTIPTSTAAIPFNTFLNAEVHAELVRMGVEAYFNPFPMDVPATPIEAVKTLESVTMVLKHFPVPETTPYANEAAQIATGVKTWGGALLTDGSQDAVHPMKALTIIDAYAPLCRVVFPLSKKSAYFPLSAICDVTFLPDNSLRSILLTSPEEVINKVEFTVNDDWRGVYITHIFMPNVGATEAVSAEPASNAPSRSLMGVIAEIEVARWRTVIPYTSVKGTIPLIMSANDPAIRRMSNVQYAL